MTRTDTHKPSLLDPAEYTFAAAFYQGASDAMYMAYRDDFREYETYISWDNPTAEAVREGTQVFDGNYTAKRTCDHCGAAFNHGVLFLHIPTGDLIHVGHICASDTIGLPSKAAAAKKRAEKAAREEKARQARHEANAEWQRENSDVVEYLARMEAAEAAYREAEKPTNLPAPHPFINDMIHSFNKWGSLWPRQAEAVRKFIANENKPKPAPEPEPTTPLIEGRRTIEGVILTAKTKDSDYGIQYKMLVKEADGNKVWGTIPASILDATPNTALEDMKGMIVSLVAKVERSRDDEHFGFYSRPTNGTVKEEVAA